MFNIINKLMIMKSKFNCVTFFYISFAIFCLRQPFSLQISLIGNENNVVEDQNHQTTNKTEENDKTCKHFDETFFRGNVSQPSIFLIVPRGRLGNMMLGYSIILELQNRLKIQPFVTRKCLKFLNTTFEEETIRIKAIEDSICNHEDMLFEPFEGTFRELLTNTTYHTNKLLWLYPPTGDRNSGGYSHATSDPKDFAFNVKFEEQYELTLKSTLKIKSEFIQHSNKKLRKVEAHRKNVLRKRHERRNAKRNVAKKEVKGIESKITYVGVHNRRSDHLKFMRERENRQPLDETFFAYAFEYFREHYPNVVFIYVSEDMKWGKENLAHLGKNDIYFIGNEVHGVTEADHDANPTLENELTSRSSSLDFALLASCNHTIGSRGTFSIWAARFAGGYVITENASRYKKFKERHKNKIDIKSKPKRDDSEL